MCFVFPSQCVTPLILFSVAKVRPSLNAPYTALILLHATPASVWGSGGRAFTWPSVPRRSVSKSSSSSCHSCKMANKYCIIGQVCGNKSLLNKAHKIKNYFHWKWKTVLSIKLKRRTRPNSIITVYIIVCMYKLYIHTHIVYYVSM